MGNVNIQVYSSVEMVIKFTYHTHRTHNITDIVFIWNSCMFRAKNGQVEWEMWKGMVEVGNTYIFKFSSVYFISFGGIFLSVLFLNKKKEPFSIWPANRCCLGKLYSSSGGKDRRRKLERKLSSFSFSRFRPACRT